MDIKKIKGKEAIHPHLGRVLITGSPKRSRVMVNIQCIDRGPGWDDVKERYVGVRASYMAQDGRRTRTWYRGENRQYGAEDTVHVNDLIFSK